MEKEIDTNPKEPQFSRFLEFLMLLWMGVGAFGIIFTLATEFKYLNFYLICSLILTATNIVAIYLLYNLKPIGLYIFYGVLVLDVILGLLTGQEDVGRILFTSVAKGVVFSLLLFLRRDGISGWKVLFGKKNTNSAIALESPVPPLGPTTIVEEEQEQSNVAIDLSQSTMTESINIEEEKGEDTIVDSSTNSIPSPENAGDYITTEYDSTLVMFEPNEANQDNDSESQLIRKSKRERRAVSIPLWILIVCLMAILSLFVLQFVRIGQFKYFEQSGADVVNQDKDSLAWVNWAEYGLDKESYSRNSANAVGVYEKLNKKMDAPCWSDYEEFSSMMSMVTYRMMVYNLLGRNRKRNSFEEFDKTFYPSTEEHLRKERDRRWLYRKFQERNLIDETYDSFCRRLCNDADLVVFYDQGINIGLNLGGYELFVEALR